MFDSKVSIVIPCYNDGKYLLDALGSLEGCSLPYEVIIVDDGSTDEETVALLGSLQDKAITLIRQLNSGVAVARNCGISRARSPFIVPLDADNRLFMPGLLRAFELIQEDARLAVVYGDVHLFGRQTSVWVNKPLEICEMIFSNQIDACALLRKTAWEDVGGYPVDKAFQSHADWLIWLSLLNNGWKFKYLGGKFFDYRTRQDSMLQTEGKNMRKITKIHAYAYGIQKQLVARLVSERAISKPEAQHLLGRAESRLAYYQLLYGSFFDGVRVWFLSIRHAPQMIISNLRIAFVCPVKRLVIDIFKVDPSFKMVRGQSWRNKKL